MQVKAKKEEKFKQKLQKVLATQNLKLQHDLIRRMARELNVSIEECAAALAYLYQPNLYESMPPTQKLQDKLFEFEVPAATLKNKTVSYRLDVGSDHCLQQEELKDLLVAEAGVDRGRIKRIDIRQQYTIVDLPDGMPADIFQLLSDLKIRHQKLNIRRLKPHRKFRRFRKAE